MSFYTVFSNYILLGDYSLGTLVGTQALIETLSEHTIPPTTIKSPLAIADTVKTVSEHSMPPNSTRLRVIGGNFRGVETRGGASVQSLSVNKSAYPSSIGISPTAIKSPLAIAGTGEYIFIFFGLFVTLIIAITCIIVALSRPLLLTPEGSSRVFGNKKRGPAKCAVCQQSMEKLDSQSLVSYLSLPEQVAQKVGSVSFDGWRCPKCHSNLTAKGIHVRAYVIENKKFTTCSTCKELTVERTLQVLKSASKIQEGQLLIIEKCHCCSYFQEWRELIPQMSSSYSYHPSDDSNWEVASSSWDNSSYSGGDGGSSDSGSSGSSFWGSSGDFGAGDCGGGGDGGSW